MKSFLQSDIWMEFQKSLGRKVFDVEGAKVIKHDLPFGRSYLYIPYGPDAVSFQFAGEVRRIAEQEQAIFIKAEPMRDEIAQALVRVGFRHTAKHIQPHKTVVLDLAKSEEELLSAMHPKTRYNIRVAEKHGIQIKPSNNVEIFWKLMRNTTERDKFHAHAKEYYQSLLKFCELHVAYTDQTAVAAAIILKFEDKAYYLHGASDHEYRNLMAPYMLHWSIMTKLQTSNIQSYDLWGIDAQRWPGVTRFKLGWGGRTVEYPGAFDLTISKPWYWAYSLKNLVK